MNAVEIEEAISAFAELPFDGGKFPFAFLQAFGNKDTTIKRLRAGSTRCLIPQCGGTLDHHAWREELWGRFYTAAPGRLRQSVERYSGVKRA